MKYFKSNFMNNFSVIPISLSKFKKKKIQISYTLAHDSYKHRLYLKSEILYWQ